VAIYLGTRLVLFATAWAASRLDASAVRAPEEDGAEDTPSASLGG